MATLGKITPCLWFDDDGEEAAAFYTGIFKNSSIGDITRYGEAGPGEPGTVMTVEFELDGLKFVALNGGPEPGFEFNESISFQIACETQAEVDHFWTSLTADGGQEVQCGWLKDKFGVSWQVVPTALPELLGDADPGRRERVMKAMLAMKKIDIEEIRRAADSA